MKLHERLVMFSDAVFAIAITILAIELRPPAVHGPEPELAQALFAAWPKVLSFGISFAVIGGYWVGHLRAFRCIGHVDGGLVAVNLTLLAAVSFLPFPTAVLGEAGDRAAAVVFYAGSVAMIGVLQAVLWVWVALRPGLLLADAPRHAVRSGILRSLGAAAVFGISVPIALAHPLAAMLTWLAVIPVLYLASGGALRG
jgi:uncharacterized membrane protein